MNEAILIVDDEAVFARNAARFLTQHGYVAKVADSAEEALALSDAVKPDAALVDFSLPGMDGITLLAKLRERDPGLPVIVLTGHGHTQLAVNAMKAGAADYLSKPIALDEIRLALAAVLERQRATQALDYYKRRDGRGGIAAIYGESLAMRALKSQLERIVAAERQLREGGPPAVLITGETGTGKELVARALHTDGARASGPFVEINCAALPGTLLESELFGYERGAFTDAKARKTGLAEAADRGTLFLDEIGDVDLQTQVKLLKLIEEKNVRRLGSTRDTPVDVRIVAATNRPLEEMVSRGEFRADLFFRLRMISVALPPLRKRGEDVLALAEQFLARQRRRYGKPGLRFGAAARAVLEKYPWPGNVRELRNLVEQAVLLCCSDTIEPQHLPVCTALAASTTATAAEAPTARDGSQDAATRYPSAATAPRPLAEIERDLIEDALRRTRWNVTRAAQLLGISRDTMRYRIVKHGLNALPETDCRITRP